MINKLESISIKKLKLSDSNPRTISKNQFDKLCRSLENDPDFLIARPILVHETIDGLEVYAGNQRVRAAKKLGWKEIPCIIEKDLSENIIKERALKDNAHYGTWDFDLLANEYEINDLLEVGFTEHELAINYEPIKENNNNKTVEETSEASNSQSTSICPHCGK